MTNSIWDSTLGMLTTLWAGRSMVRFSPRQVILLFPKTSSLLFSTSPGWGGARGGGEQLGHKVTSYLSRMPWLRANGSVLIFPLMPIHTAHKNRVLLAYIYQASGARGSAVGWGIALQTGRSGVWFSMVSLEFFIYIILPAALWPWGWLNL
jgi:hypothetical protein